MNNKGISLVEIVISITIISIVVVFLFSLFVSAREDEREANSSHDMQVNQAILTREINADFIERELIGVHSCVDGSNRSLDTVRSILNTPNNNYDNSMCIKLIYNPAKGDDNIGYLIYYTYKDSNNLDKYILNYTRGLKNVVRETSSSPIGEMTLEYKCQGITCTVRIKMPIIDYNDVEYSLDLTYITESEFQTNVVLSPDFYNLKRES